MTHLVTDIPFRTFFDTVFVIRSGRKCGPTYLRMGSVLSKGIVICCFEIDTVIKSVKELVIKTLYCPTVLQSTNQNRGGDDTLIISTLIICALLRNPFFLLHLIECGSVSVADKKKWIIIGMS